MFFNHPSTVGDVACQSMVALGVCETLVARLSFPWEQVGLPQLALMFSLLATSDDGAKRLNVTCTYELLAELFRVHIMDEVAMYAGCSVMHDLLRVDRPDVTLISLCVVEGVVASMRAHPTSDMVSVAGTLAITSLMQTSRPGIRLKLDEAGAVEVLKAAMLTFPENGKISELGKKALYVLASQR
jgi:hypothetical protein